MSLKPAKIFNDIKKERINLKEGIQLLLTFIENNHNNDLRLSGLKYLRLLNIKNESIFSLLESLLISDTHEKIRSFCAEFIGQKYVERALSPISWALKYEKNYFCQISLIKAIAQIDKDSAKKILVNQMKKICSRNYIGNQNLYSNLSFIRSIEYYENFNWDIFSVSELADILINYKTISNLIKKFYYVFFEWKKGLIVKLDLSELGWNVSRAWNFTYAGRLSDLKEIPEIFNLKHLENLDLSNNRLKSIKELIKLSKIKYLYLRNNKLEAPENINYLKKMHNLRHLDIRSNKIVNYINREEFSNLNLVLKNQLVFM